MSRPPLGRDAVAPGEGVVYLNHAAAGVLPVATRDAIVRVVDGLRARGCELLTERGEGISSGIVTFRVAGRDPVELGRALGRAGIVTTYRRSGIRVSPHGYNTREELAALLEALG